MFDLCAIGNALVDIIVPVSDDFLRNNRIVKGSMALVDQAAASVLYDKVGPAVELSSGGSVANTLAGAAALGSSCCFLGKVGEDTFGEVFTHDLLAQKVTFLSKPSAEIETGRCLILVTPDAQRSMNTYLGAAVDFGPDDIDEGAIRDSRITYLEGYLFDKPLAQQAFKKATTIAHEAGNKVAVTLSDVFCVSRHRDDFLDLLRAGVDILFANENEMKELYQTHDVGFAVASARHHVDLVVTTRGADGALVATNDHVHTIKAHPVASVVDTTGAGDLYAAGFLHGLSQGKDLVDCGVLGSLTAAEIISHYGPRPQTDLKEFVAKALS